MNITVLEYLIEKGEKCDNPEGVAYRFIVCPFCSKSQAFRFTSPLYCKDCNNDIIDAMKLRYNMNFKIAYHLGMINQNGGWVGDVPKWGIR